MYVGACMNTVQISMNIPAKHMSNVFGSFDGYRKTIEDVLSVSIIQRNGETRIEGSETACRQARQVLTELLALSEKGSDITEQQVNYALDTLDHASAEDIIRLNDDILTINTSQIPAGAFQRHIHRGVGSIFQQH